MSLELIRVDEPFSFELRNEEGIVCGIDANPSIGGKGKGFRPMELLAGSLAGCASIDVILILKKQRIEPTHFGIKIETRRSTDIPAVFEEIKLIFEVNPEVPREKMEKAIRLTIDKYCSVSASLKESVDVQFEVKYIF